MRAGDLTKRVAFQSPIEDRDRNGKIVQSWRNEFTVWAHVKALRGGETVMQARVAAKAPAIVTVRRSSQSRQIQSDWRAVIDGRIYDIKELPRMSDDRAYLEMLAEGRA